jgi:hypothetical protein
MKDAETPVYVGSTPCRSTVVRRNEIESGLRYSGIRRRNQCHYFFTGFRNRLTARSAILRPCSIPSSTPWRK